MALWDDLVTYAPDLLSGLGLTLALAAVSLVVATVLAVFVSLARMSRRAAIRIPARVLIDVVRGTPLLLQIFFIYYALPEFGLAVNAFVAGVAALGLNYGAYMAEVFRGAIEALPVGQTRAAEALGLKPAQIFVHVIFPQAVRTIYPTYVGMVLGLIKDTSLVAIITLQELLLTAQVIVARTFKPFEFYLIVAIIYLIVSYVVSLFAGWLENRLRTPGSQGASTGGRRRGGGVDKFLQPLGSSSAAS